MSERSLPESVGPVREIRPAEDLSLLHAYELRRVFEAETISSLDLVHTREVDTREEDAFRPISAPFPVKAPDEARPAEPGTFEARKVEDFGPSDAVAVHRGAEAEATGLAEEPPRRDWLLQPEPQAGGTEAQRYGDDPVRLRELVQFFADGRAASASVLVPRAAGDLVDVPAQTRDWTQRLKPVVASGRIV